MTKNRLGKFNLFWRITQANDCIAILFHASAQFIIWTSRKCFRKRKSQNSWKFHGEWQHGHDSTLHSVVNASNLRSSEAQSNFKKFQIQRKKGPPPLTDITLSPFKVSHFCLVELCSTCSVFFGSLQHLMVHPGFLSLCLCHVMLIVFDCILSVFSPAFLSFLHLVRLCVAAGSLINEAAEVMVVLGICGTAAWIQATMEKTPDYHATRCWPCNVAKHSYFLQIWAMCIAVLPFWLHTPFPTVLDVINGQHGVV